MIRVTRLNSQPILLNSDLIEQIETVPDTMIALSNGHRLYVREPAEEIRARIVAFRKELLAGSVNSGSE